MAHRQLTLALILLLTGSVSAQAVTFNNVVTLGDSLLDDSGGGRSPVVAEHVANRLDISVTKFAESGSTSTDMIEDGQHTQAAAQFGTGDLAMLWIGGNDFFTNAIDLATGNADSLDVLEANTDLAMQTLNHAGLDIAILNLPDMSKVPGVKTVVNLLVPSFPRFLRESAFENITQSTVAWNSRIDALAQDYDATVIDVFGLFEEFSANPGAFSVLGNDPILGNSGCQFCVFFDDFLLPDVHPSSLGQGYIANEAIETLNQRYDPDSTMPLAPLSVVELALLADLYAGDFDRNDVVNSNDLSQWRDDYGSPGADADGDGDTDGADFLIWQRQFMGLGTALSPTIAVPEPTAAASALLGLLLLFVKTPRKR